MSLKTYLNDWIETDNIREWRIKNNIQINEEFLAKVYKRERIRTKFWRYLSAFAFIAGIFVGMGI